MLQLYLIRHAQSQNNALYAESDSFEGRRSDPELTELGQRQAERLARHLASEEPTGAPNGRDPHNRRGFGLTHLYTSLFQRAIQTALPIARATGLPLRAWVDLHEWWGVYDYVAAEDRRIGLPGPGRAFFEQHYPELILPDELGREGWWNRPAETLSQAHERAARVVGQLQARHGDGDDRVALITHGGFSQSLLQVLLNFETPNQQLDGEPTVWMTVNNAAVSRLDWSPAAVALVYTNRLDHLPPELIT